MLDKLKNLDEEKKGIVKAVALALGLLLVVVLYALEFPHFSNTFGVKKLVLVAILAGLLLGVLLALRFSPRFNEPLERAVIILILTLFTAGVMPLLASMSNRLLSYSGMMNEPVAFFKLEAFRGSRFGNVKDQLKQVDGYYLFVIRNNKLERIQMEEPRYLGTPESQLIELPVRRGFWGFVFVDFK